MKKLTLLFLLSTIFSFGQGGIQLPEEAATFAIFVDPVATIKENSPNIGVEFGYQGVIYAKVQVEVLPDLPGGYTSVGGVVGGNIQINDTRLYTGVRLVPWVLRNNGSRPLIGFEAGYDWNFSSNYYIGLRATYDYRADMELLNDKAIWRLSGFIKVGYRFNLN